jgi:AraC-like DNA-binding protein
MRRRSAKHDREVIPDALSEVLQDLRLAGAHYCRCEVAEPWGIELPPGREATFHLVVQGHCWLDIPSSEPTRLDVGDLVLLPHGTGHRLLAHPGAPSRRIDQLPADQLGDNTYRLRTGGEGARSLLVCCGVTFEEPTLHPLIDLMPPFLIVRGEGHRDPTLSALLEAMAREVSEQRIGAATVMTRLADTVITRLVREWVESQVDDTSTWLAAIRDPRLGKALADFHREPYKEWSVESLAAAANLSRSVFSERFTALLGMSPARYVARWRMHLAGTWLRNGQRTVDEVASSLGYRSAAAFSRAFKRLMGTPPGAYRR